MRFTHKGYFCYLFELFVIEPYPDMGILALYPQAIYFHLDDFRLTLNDFSFH